MDDSIATLIDTLDSHDNQARCQALFDLQARTELPVDWAYVVWDRLAAKLDSKNAFDRAIGMFLLCNLAQSDPEKRLDRVLPTLLAMTEDQKFIPRRQTIQTIWKVAYFRPDLREAVTRMLIEQFTAGVNEEHPNLIRRDIVQSLLTLAELTHDETLTAQIDQLIRSEPDEKERKKLLETHPTH